MSAAAQPTTYLILGPHDLPRLAEWRTAVSERFGGCTVEPVLISGARYTKRLKNLRQYAIASLAAAYVAANRRDGDNLYMLVPEEGDPMLTGFVNMGVFPRYVETKRWRPSDLPKGAAPSLMQPGLGTAQKAA